MPSEDIDLNLAAESLHGLLAGPALGHIQELLPAYLLRQRWFGAKSRTIACVRILDWVQLPSTPAALVFLEVTYADASAEAKPDVYQLPLALTTAPEADAIQTNSPDSILTTVTIPGGPAILHDATAREDVRQAFLDLIETATTLTATTSNPEPRTSNPTLAGHTSSAFAAARGTEPLPARTGSAEQSNTSILYGRTLILKLFRRLQPGENPDAEIGRFLTDIAHFPRIPAFLGDIRGSRAADTPPSEQTTLAMLQGLVENEGDGWQHTLDELSRYYAAAVTFPMPIDTGDPPSFLDNPIPPPVPTEVRERAGLPAEVRQNASYPAEIREHAGLSLAAAALLGRRTADLHLALATPTDDPAFAPNFAPEPFTAEALAADTRRIRTQIVHTLDALKQAFPNLTGDLTIDSAALILSRRVELFSRALALVEIQPAEAGQRIRIHGDYHLGQVLRTRGDYVILDFEGEPARPLAERRAKQSPLKDVAGMLRSFSYAAYAALDRFTRRQPAATAARLEPWAQLWQNAVATEFLTAWRTTIAANPLLIPSPIHADRMLRAYLLEKALYELLYELNNRPTWVRIPLAGILSLPQTGAS